MGKHPGGVQNPAQRKYGTGASLRGRNVSDQTGVIFKLRIAASLPNLTQFIARENNLTGPLIDFASLPKLITYDVGYNQLSGQIPDFHNIVSVKTISASGNNLTGTIPNFSNVSALVSLAFSGNQLSGSIPNFSNLSNLSSLKLDFNQLTDNIPSFTNLQLLTSLNLSDNYLTGVVPVDFGMPSLTKLNLANNQLEGFIPDFSNLSNLIDLNISYNKFQGTLQSFSSLENLVFLKVNNNLIDSLNDEELQYFNDLSLFNCSNNNLTFDDVIGLSGVSTIYFPQKALELPDTISVFAGQDFNLSLDIDNGITNNNYDWFKNGSELFNTNENTITLNAVLEVNSGSYFVRVFNSEAPDLILESTTFFLQVIYTPVTIDFDIQIESCPSALDGEISIFTEGGVPPYSYQWSTGHESTPVVSNLSSGDYFLTVTDSADSSLVFSFNLPPHNLPIANTIADTIACGSSITITGNPSGDNVFGKWETASESIIENSFFYNTYVSNLDSGANIFTWAFSTDTCPRYTVDTVTVISARAPNVADDQVDIDEGSLIQLTPNENDWIQPELEWSINFNNYSPGIYDLEFKDGVLDISLKEERSSILVHSLNYEICYKECPNLCDEALITLRENFFNKNEIPNAFTPNGDGVNDIFEISELDGPYLLSSNIKLVVFNRWGDLVFSASPYSNNWDGTNIYSGKPLPEGTYYFKLWLDSTSSELMEGSVTILR